MSDDREDPAEVADEGLFGPATIPERIGEFRVVEELPGRRGEQTFRVRSEDHEGDVLLRLFHAGSGHDSLLREARRLTDLSHENLVRVYGAGMAMGCFYLSSELVEGATLRDWLAARRRRVPRIFELFCGVAEGLAAAHHAGLVHGDVTPSAIVVSPADEGVLGGFTLAGSRRLPSSGDYGSSAEQRFLESSPLEPVTVLEGLLATPAYMAPERHRGAPADPQSDQFSFCATLYEALYGQRPFAGDTLEEVADNITAGAIAQHVGKPSVPAAMEDVILRGLSSDPSERFASMDELVDAMSAARARGRLGCAGALLAVIIVGALAVGAAYALQQAGLL